MIDQRTIEAFSGFSKIEHLTLTNMCVKFIAFMKSIKFKRTPTESSVESMDNIHAAILGEEA